MTTAQLEEKIYAALVNDEKVMELLHSESSIFHIRAPAVYPDYPIIVYSVLSDVPALHADNSENAHRVTIRIHIITGENDYAPIYAEVKRIMAELDFVRVQSTPFFDEDEKFILVTDWKIILGDD